MASYYVWSGATGTATGATWANAKTTLAAMLSASAAGDTIYVAHDHAETTAGNINLFPNGTVSNPSKVVCVNRAGSVPPVSADRRATAQVTSTTNSTLQFGIGTGHFDGIIFNIADGTNQATISPQVSAPHWTRFDNCSLRLVGTNFNGKIQHTTAGTYVEFNNTTVSFSNVLQSITVGGPMKWRNTLSALLGAAVPTTLFVPGGTAGGSLECIGVDLSAAGTGKTIVGAVSNAVAQKYNFLDCKLDAAVTKSAVPLSHASTEIDFVRSGATGVNYNVYRHRISGSLQEETTIVRTGGASDGTTTIAWKIVTTATCSYSMPFECPPIAIWNDTVGSAKTATVEGIWGGGAVPNDDDVWLDVEYLGSSSSPQGSFVNDGKADLVATAAGQTSSSATWGGSTTKFKLAVTFTPQQKGWVYARAKCAKASSTFYIDPKVTLS